MVPALQGMLARNGELRELAEKALVSYVRSVHLQPDKRIFRAPDLDLAGLAHSFGLVTVPHLRLVSRGAGDSTGASANDGTGGSAAGGEAVTITLGGAGDRGDEYDAPDSDDDVESASDGDGVHVTPVAEEVAQMPGSKKLASSGVAKKSTGPPSTSAKQSSEEAGGRAAATSTATAQAATTIPRAKAANTKKREQTASASSPTVPVGGNAVAAPDDVATVGDSEEADAPVLRPGKSWASVPPLRRPAAPPPAPRLRKALTEREKAALRKTQATGAASDAASEEEGEDALLVSAAKNKKGGPTAEEAQAEAAASASGGDVDEDSEDGGVNRTKRARQQEVKAGDDDEQPSRWVAPPVDPEAPEESGVHDGHSPRSPRMAPCSSLCFALPHLPPFFPSRVRPRMPGFLLLGCWWPCLPVAFFPSSSLPALPAPSTMVLP